jgi:hypothetical protein
MVFHFESNNVSYKVLVSIFKVLFTLTHFLVGMGLERCHVTATCSIWPGRELSKQHIAKYGENQPFKAQRLLYLPRALAY